jgi:hypothetical protein
VPACLIAPPPQLTGPADARKHPATRHKHLVPHNPLSSSQSHFFSSVLNSVIGAAPSKSAALGEPRPAFFLTWTLTKVVHLMDLFSFYPGRSKTCISRHRPPSLSSSLMAASAGVSPPLLRPLCAEEKCRGVQRATGAGRGRLHRTRDITDRLAFTSSHHRPPTARAGVSGPCLLTPPLLLSNLGLAPGQAATGNTRQRGLICGAGWAVLATCGPSSGAGRKPHWTEAVGQKLAQHSFQIIFQIREIHL